MRHVPGIVAAACFGLLLGCGGGSGSTGGTTQPTVRTYSGSAAVGDFLTITVDSGAKTITYVNRTNGDTGTVPYTLRTDGGMDVTDPSGDIDQCYELPGVVLVGSGTNLGPAGSRQPALIYGVEQAKLTLADIANVPSGFMQFRTKEGGIEVGHMTFDASDNGTQYDYLPVNLVLPPGWYGKPLYYNGTVPSSAMSNNAALGTVDMVDGGSGATSHIFGTPGGNWIADSGQGAVIAFRDAATKDFDPTRAGTYSALVYHKTVDYLAGVETGSPTIGTATVTITAAGAITVAQGGTTIFSSTVLPFEGSPWQGAGKIVEPVHGLFYCLDSGSASSYGTPPLFMTFLPGGLAFGEFIPIATGDFSASPQVPAQYGYTYGIAVKLP